MTVEEFLALPEKEAVKRELSDGALIEEQTTLGNANSRHEIVKANFGEALRDYKSLGKVFTESLFLLNENAREPDVAFVAKARLIAGDPDSYRRGAPDIAIEVVSSEKASELERKVRQYCEAGSHFVWVAYPKEREIAVYDRDRNARVLTEDSFLEAPGVLPGFQVRVSKLFEGI